MDFLHQYDSFEGNADNIVQNSTLYYKILGKKK